MEKKQKKGMKKLFISMVAMMLAIVGAATSTYAWFTMTAAPQVGEFQVKVATISGLEIALDTRNVFGGTEGIDGSGTMAPTGDYKGLDYKTYLNGAEVENHIKSIVRAAAEPGRGLSANTVTDALVLAPSQSTDGKVFKDLGGVTAKSFRDGGAAGVGRFVGAPATLNHVGFLEFTLYFRINDADWAASSKEVVFDMTNYTAGGTADHKDTGDDIRTFVTNESTEVTDFTLPTKWSGPTTGFVPAADTDYDILGEYIVIDHVTGDIKGINMYKYLNTAEAGAGIFVDPATGVLMHFNTGTYEATEADPEYYNSQSHGPVRVAGVGANALRLSFSQIKTANITNKLDEEAAVLWNPRDGLGKFNADGADDNFALHMLRASGRDTTIPGSYQNGIIKGRTQTDIGAETIVDLDDTKAVSDGGYKYGATTVRLWVDGWDAECFNGIMADIANIGFQFKMK